MPPDPTPPSHSPSGASSPESQAEELFAGALRADGAPDLAALIERAPELAEELKRLHADWHWLEGALAPRGDEQASADGVEPRSVDRFAVLGELGRGGMGTVYRVWDDQLHRELALKVADGGVPITDRARGRFLDEAQVTGQLEHPGIVPVHDVGVDERGRPWFTMSLVEGQDLGAGFADRAAQRGGWDTTRAIRALASVADTLAFAHDRGVLHRDLKPSNVMVGPFGQVYVMDWGLSRVLAEAAEAPHVERGDELRTLHGAVLGTPAYMAPEQARGEPVTPASDVYALGALLYELLSGQPPYEEVRATRGTRGVLEAARQRPPRPVRELAPPALGELGSIVERAMAREPEQRYAGMVEMAEDLRAYLEQRVVSAHRSRPWTRAVKWLRRNRALAAALALVGLALLGTAAREWRARGVLERANADLELEQGRTDQALERAEHHAHRSRLSAAQALLALGLGRQAREQLEACAEENRGWAWRHLSARVRGARVRIPPAPPEDAAFLCIAPAGPWLAGRWVPNGRGGVELFDLDGTLGGSIPRGANQGIRCCEFDRAGTAVAVVEHSMRLTLWSAEPTPQRLAELDLSGDGQNSRSTYDREEQDGRLGLLSEEGLIHVIDLDDLSVVHRVRTPLTDGARVLHLRPARSEAYYVTRSRELVRLDLATGAVRGRVTLGSPTGRWGRIELCSSPDGATIAVGTIGRGVELRDADTLEVLRRLPLTAARILDLEFDPSGEQLLVAPTAGRARLWRPYAGQEERLSAPSSPVLRVFWGRDEQHPITAHADGSLRESRAESGGWIAFDLGPDLVPNWLVDPARGRLYAQEPGAGVLIFGLTDGAVQGALPFYPAKIVGLERVGAAGDLLCTYDQLVHELVLRDGATLEQKAHRNWHERPVALVPHPAGAEFVVREGPLVQRLDAQDLSTLGPWCSAADLRAIAFDPTSGDGFVIRDRGRLEQRAFPSGKLLQERGELGPIVSVAVSGDGQRVAIGSAESVRILRASDLATLHELVTNGGDLPQLSFLGDSELLGVSRADNSASQGQFELFDPADGSRVLTLGQSDTALRSVRFVPGSRLAAGFTYDGEIVVLTEEADLGVSLRDPALTAQARALVEQRSKEWPQRTVLLFDLACDTELDPALRTHAVHEALRTVTDLAAVEAQLERLLEGDPQLRREPDLSIATASLFRDSVGSARGAAHLAGMLAALGDEELARGTLEVWENEARPSDEERARWRQRIEALLESSGNGD